MTRQEEEEGRGEVVSVGATGVDRLLRKVFDK